MVQGVRIENGAIVDVDPATGEVIAHVPTTSPDALEAIIAQARASQPAWASTPLEERGALLKAACAGLAGRRQPLAQTIVREMGKVLREAEEEVGGAVDKDAFIDLVLDANRPVPLDGGRSVVVRQPHGVVALCTPWNFPADEILLLALPALAAGNVVIVKPSEVTPLAGAMVMEALAAALPAGVASLVQGDGAVGAALVEHRDVDMVAMTGSSATGRRIMSACSQSLKRLVLELGGKDPMVVFADADLDRAADDAVAYSLANCGQVCSAIERVYVAEAVRAAFEERVLRRAAAWTVGNGFDAAVKVGPMVSEAQRQVVDRHVSDAVAQGAKLLYQVPLLMKCPN